MIRAHIAGRYRASEFDTCESWRQGGSLVTFDIGRLSGACRAQTNPEAPARGSRTGSFLLQISTCGKCSRYLAVVIFLLAVV